MIRKIHVCGDHQTSDFTLGVYGCYLIERFNIKGQFNDYPRIRVHLDGYTVELDEAGLAIYEDKNE